LPTKLILNCSVYFLVCQKKSGIQVVKNLWRHFILNNIKQNSANIFLVSKQPNRRDLIMGRKNNRIVIDSMTVWKAQKPKYNGFACGYGAHENKRGYNRAKEKREFLREW
jgi:hypothetical protein